MAGDYGLVRAGAILYCAAAPSHGFVITVKEHTMRRSQSSMTAVGIAIVRAIESDRPEAERICYDPYARQFVNGALYQFVRFFDRLGYSERRGPGVMGFLTVRERHIDEYLKTCLANVVRQVVI